MAGSTNNSSVNLAYDALATELILYYLNDFGTDIQWRGRFEELDAPVQARLRAIDHDVQEFVNLRFPSEESRFQRLLAIFFDCYLGFQQGTDTDERYAYRGLIREPWQRRFRKHKSYVPQQTEQNRVKKFLCTYTSGLDFPMRLNNRWLDNVVKKVAAAERKSTDQLIRELGEFLQEIESWTDVQPPTNVKNPFDILKVLLTYIKLTNSGRDWTSKFDIQKDAFDEAWDLIDLVNEIAAETGQGSVLGGAAATGAQTLSALNEPDVDLLVPFPSPTLLEHLDTTSGQHPNILWYDADNKFQKYAPKTLKEFIPNSKNPEIHNFVIEFSSGTPIVYCTCCGAGLTPQTTDRLILRNRYAFYQSDGRINRDLTQLFQTQLKVNGLFGFDSSINTDLTVANCEALAKQVAAQGYDVLIVAGLQSLESSVFIRTENELGIFRATNTKTHIEVSGTKNFDWLIELIPQYIYSVSIGDELGSLFQAVNERILDTTNDPIDKFNQEKQQKVFETYLREKPRGFQKVIQALKVAHFLSLKRLYVHDIDMDIIIREGDLTVSDRLGEIRSDLIAKWVVLRKLMSRGQVNQNQARDTMTQVKEEGLNNLLEACQAIYDEQGLLPDGNIELYGTYFPDYKRSVILVPIRWVYGAMQDQLRVVGAGDTTSIVSAAQVI